jgi:hypothetical protein
MPILDCPSIITRVTVYARGAVVTRRLDLPPLPPEACTLRLSGLSPTAQTGSLRTLADGERLIVGLTSRLVQEAAATQAEPASLEKLRIELSRVQTQLERSTQRRDHLAEITLTSAILTKKSDTNVAGRVGDALAISALLFDLTRKLDEEIAALTKRQSEYGKAIEAGELAASQGEVPQSGPTREVEISLGPGPSHLRSLEISYAVPAARWWPAYSARIFDSGKRAEFGLEAFVAQQSLEDWNGVALTLCTADMAQDIRLPELPSLRLGRAQPPKKRGYRPAPEGLDALFAGFDASGGVPDVGMISGKVAPSKSAPADKAKKGALKRDAEYERREMADEVGASSVEDATRMYQEMAPEASKAMAPPRGMPMPQNAPMPATIAAPMRQRSGAAPKDLDDGMAFGGGAGNGADFRAEPPPPPPDVSEDWLDFDSLILPEVSNRWRRGKLTAAGALGFDLSSAMQAVEYAQAHVAARDVRQSRGLFDHQFSAEGKAEIPSNGRASRVFLLSREAACAMRFTCVACEDDRVFREAELANPLNAPLLPGPVDVFVEGALLTTSELAMTDRGGKVRVGLGVEERLRVVRNVRSTEESKGMLGGSTAVHHFVGVEVTSSLPGEVSVEVIERLPVTDDKEITVTIDKADPKPEAYDQKTRGQAVKGGRLFKLALKAGAKAAVILDYTITLPAGSELLGGNRRE